ncbi:MULTISPECIES: hypothetical protein [unclassified Breznakia]|uniref:hypothetical protein n=1 Tax=unclassified Breznakia TaxID=2623764 RepID=UPI002474AD85|nr:MULTISPECIES: hypothetical protein [unclassified Breznakia]MDH6367052.1 hypothetical protein [Breznakia sp. PH1-1]MDH6404176.1 hypothetical protein [Breznakia sp. PF1-11]MDH6411939.1 hypothetical protein [Breznakia sp. PFB1-11]MDH6414164.1 hypothetical protein [Breznakia sp. PFB1-14]MDH6418917.1 hypothetical protein [Breznakia sp. PFB1-12]
MNLHFKGASLDEAKMKQSIEQLLNDYVYYSFLFKRFTFTLHFDEQGYYTDVVIDKDSLDDDVSTAMSNSASVIRYSGNSDSTSYERRLIDEIDRSAREEKWLNEFLKSVRMLPVEEKHFIIAKYYVCEPEDKIKDFLGIEKSKLYHIKSRALYMLAILLPSHIRLRQI